MKDGKREIVLLFFASVYGGGSEIAYGDWNDALINEGKAMDTLVAVRKWTSEFMALLFSSMRIGGQID